MIAPKMCPVCGSESIETTFPYATLSVSFDGMQCNISGVQAYFCGDSHFFLVVGEKAALERPEENSRGASLFL